MNEIYYRDHWTKIEPKRSTDRFCILLCVTIRDAERLVEPHPRRRSARERARAKWGEAGAVRRR